MNDIERESIEVPAPLLETAAPGNGGSSVPTTAPARRGWGGRLFGIGALLILGTGLAYGAWRSDSRDRTVLASAQEQRDRVPSVSIAKVQASHSVILVSQPATTQAFTTANIFARASGYIDIRKVDIGDRVRAGDLLAHINAPEVDHQIAQAEATLIQLKASLEQAQAQLELARVTWNRDRPLVDKGWVTQQQGTIDVQTLKAQAAAVGVAQANIVAQEAQLKVLRQTKIYQTVVAPFDGVVTQRNINIGDLVQADATTQTFMFTVMQTDVIRTQVYVPQDQAFGLSPGDEAIVRVPEIPDRTFRGKVTRVADALQPGTRTLLTEIDIPNPDRALTPGVYCSVEIHVPRKTPTVTVPAEAIVFNRDGMQVIVIENGIARIRKVSVARDFGTTLELYAGVKEGEVVILNPPLDLADGARVQPRPMPARASQ